MTVPREISATTHHRKPGIFVTLTPRVFGAPWRRRLNQRTVEFEDSEIL
jgi:hypothetical protein